jgi:YVTN family beta-propeller protein
VRRRRVAAAILLLVVGLVLALMLQAAGTVEPAGNLGATADQEVPSRAGATQAAAGVAPASTPAWPATRHRLRVVTHPTGAELVMRLPDGSTRTVTTPYTGRAPGGELSLALSRPGYNPLNQQVVLDRRRSLDLWLDPEGLLHHKLGEFTTGSLPKQVAFSPGGEEIWVTPLGESGIEVYDAATFRRLTEIDTGRYGTVEISFSSDGSTVFASQMQTATIFEIDAETYEVRRQLDTGSVWSKVMALSPDGTKLYVANWSGDNVTEIDLATGKVLRQLPSVDMPRGLFVAPDGRRLFIAGFGRGELQRIDLVTGRSRVLLTTGGAMRHLVGDPDRGLLYADDMATDEAFVVDLATEEVRELAATDHSPNTMDLSPDGKVLYVSNRGENNPISYSMPGPEWGTVVAIDTASGRLLDAIVGGDQTTGLDVSPDGRLLAFSDFLDNRVSVYEIPEYETLANGDGGRVQDHLSDLEKNP